MSTATKVPETRDMTGDELSADEALASLRRYGRWPLLRDSFVRFRYADGFSHSRALALQTVLAVIPLAIAFVGLSTALHTENIGRLAELTIHRIAQGPSADVVDDALDRSRHSAGDGDQIALWFGLVFSLVNVTTAMCQIECGANRIYGNERDRPFHQKYLRGLVMSLSAGIPHGLGFIVMVAAWRPGRRGGDGVSPRRRRQDRLRDPAPGSWACCSPSSRPARSSAVPPGADSPATPGWPSAPPCISCCGRP